MDHQGNQEPADVDITHVCGRYLTAVGKSETFRGHVVQCLLTMGVPSITKIWVAPKSAMALFGLSLKTAPAKAGAGEEIMVLWEEQVLDAATMILL